MAGNYDVAIARAHPDCGCRYSTDDAFAQHIYDHTLQTCDRDFAAWMGTLPTEQRLRIAGCDLHLVHGSPLGLNDFWWESLPEPEHRARARASGADVLDYDRRAQAASIRAADLPEAFVETIETGWWAPCIEDLPPAESAAGRYQLYRSTPASEAPQPPASTSGSQ